MGGAFSRMQGTTALHRAVKHENVEELEKLLSQFQDPIDVNTQEHSLGNTALHLAAFIKHPQKSLQTCRLLLDAGAHKDLLDRFSMSPADVAETRGNTETASFIRSHDGRGNWFSRKRQLNTVFDAFDLDCNGLIEEDELHEINKGLHPQGWTAEQNRAMLHQVDRNSDGRINREELFAYYKKNLAKLHERQFQAGVDQLLNAGLQASRLTNYQLGRLKQLFAVFDEDDDGVISEQEFWSISSRMSASKLKGDEWTREDSKAAMEKFDSDGDGFINSHEFLEFFRQQLGGVSHELFEKALAMYRDVIGSVGAGLFNTI